MIPHAVLLLLLMTAPGANKGGQHSSASGSLTVTAIVTSSVSVTFSADGTQTVIVANAPADAATLTLLSTPSLAETKLKASKQTTHKDKKIKGTLNESAR